MRYAQGLVPSRSGGEARLTWAGVAHVIADKSELFEILFEAGSQVCRGTIVCLFVRPGIARNQDIAGHIGAGCGHVQAKDWVGDCLHFLDLSADHRAYHGARIVDIDTCASAIGTTTPAGVDEVATHMVFFDTLAQQVRVFSRTAWQEGRAEAGTERCLRRGYSGLGPSQLACIAGEEVVHGLPGGQL